LTEEIGALQGKVAELEHTQAKSKRAEEAGRKLFLSFRTRWPRSKH